MRRRTPRDPREDELTMAVGLVWGHLHAQQPEEAYLLARGCLELWPHDLHLNLMAAYAAAEVAEPVDMAALRRCVDGAAPALAPDIAADTAAFVALVERRAVAA